jgi:copper ion binding protein
MKKTIAIEGMHCQHCVKAVTEALSELAGVDSATVSLEAKQAVVEGSALSDDALRNAVEEVGFDVVGIN